MPPSPSCSSSPSRCSRRLNPPPPSGVIIRRVDAAAASIGIGEVAYLSPPEPLPPATSC